MSEEMLKKIFKPFEQESASTSLKYGGSGLGLSIAKSIVDLLHGSITVESKKGEGTTFVVLIPFKLEEKQERETENDQILVITDDENGLKSISKEFDGKALFLNSQQALSETYNHEFSFIIIDEQVNENLLSFVKKIKESFSNSSVLLLGSNFEDLSKDFFEGIIDDYLVKPLCKSAIEELIFSNKEKKMAKGGYDFKGFKVLLAEDQELNAEILMEILKIVKVEVTWAKNGLEAVKLFSESKINQFDLILLDVQMPLMNGYEAAKKIRKLEREDSKTVTICAMTANSFKEDIAKSMLAGMNNHLSKPINTGLLYELISKLYLHKKEKN